MDKQKKTHISDEARQVLEELYEAGMTSVSKKSESYNLIEDAVQGTNLR